MHVKLNPGEGHSPHTSRRNPKQIILSLPFFSFSPSSKLDPSLCLPLRLRPIDSNNNSVYMGALPSISLCLLTHKA